MIWHIFKKDLKLLWPLVLVVAALNIINAALQFILGHFGEPRELAQIALLLTPAIQLGIAALIVATVHQDAMPGDRQDWLVRPIHRRDLLLEKLLFVLVTIHGPMLLVDMAQCMATGFTFWSSLSTALSRGVYVLLIFSLPMLTLATMTSTLVEVIGAALAFFLFFFVFQVAARTIVIGSALSSSGTVWMTSAAQSAIFLAGAIVVIPLQYFRRATMHSRRFALGAVLLFPVFYFIPWAPAFSFQEWLSADPAAAGTIVVAFDPNLGTFTIKPGGRTRANSVWLPLRVSGLAPESFLISDRAYVRIIGRDGAILFRGRTTGDSQTTGDPGSGPLHIDDFPVRTTAGGDVRTHELGSRLIKSTTR